MSLDKTLAAFTTLEFLGYTWEGWEQWKPPLGPSKAWSEGYKHGLWQGQNCAKPAATGKPVAEVRMAHESFGFVLLGDLPPDGTRLYATPQPAPAPPGGRYKPLHPGDPYPFCGPSFEAPRNLHPGPRLAGYRGHSLYEHATSEERKAWEEGRAVREEVRRVVTSVDAPPVAFRRFTVLRPTGGKPYALGGMGWQYFDYDPDEYECNVKKALVWTGDEAVQCETTVQRIYAPAPHAQPTPALVPLTDEQALEIAVTATPPGSMASRHQIVEAIRLAERHHGIFPSKENPL